jgi:transcription termination factor NusB
MTKTNNQRWAERLAELRALYARNVKLSSEHSSAIAVLHHKIESHIPQRKTLSLDSSSSNAAACQQISDQIAAKQNEEILILAAITVSQAETILHQQDLQKNLNDQLALYGQANAMGCNLNTGP